MINLLPDNEKHILDREYKYRRAFVILASAFSLSILVFVAMVPSFILTLYKNNVSAQISNQAVKSEKEAVLEKQITEAKKLLSVLRQQSASTTPVQVVDLLIQNKTSAITITSIVYTKDSVAQDKVDVRGVAATREALSVFTDKLAHEKAIDKVDVPVSNFAKDTQIDYSFNLLLR